MTTLLGTRVTHHENAIARWSRLTPIVRADLTSPRKIRAQMAADMQSHLAAAGSVNRDDLILMGWTGAQITEHSPHAIATARRNSGQDN